MPPSLALLAWIVVALWLLARDRELRPMTSGALWVPLLWLLVIGTRPVTNWFGGEAQAERIDDYLKGSPLDAAVYLSLIVAGSIVLLWRRFGPALASNGWFLAFVLYCLLSVAWSDYPFVASKRWLKDFGNVVMVLIVFTETSPALALRAVFARYTYVAVPLSIVLIKYYPDLGRAMNRWTWEYLYCGVATDKNALGAIAALCGVFLAWDFIETRLAHSGARGRPKSSLDAATRLALMAAVLWLIVKAQSSTALLCLALGVAIVWLLRSSVARRGRRLGAYSFVGTLVVVLVYSTSGLFAEVIGLLGRDATLTGRTDLWADLVAAPINHLLGAGYASFWLGDTARDLWDKYYFHPNQAHNGYLETYLNQGLIGVFVLVAMLLATFGRLRRQLQPGNRLASLVFAFLAIGVLYNWTEATFNTLSPVWFAMIVAALAGGLAHRAAPGAEPAASRHRATRHARVREPAVAARRR